MHSAQLGERGTEIALYDYAYHLKKEGVADILILSCRHNTLSALPKFMAKFEVVLYDTFDQVDSILSQHNCTHFYTIKSGNNDGKLSRTCRNLIHCVFNLNEPHGDVYAPVSDHLAAKYANQFPAVPHMIHLPNVTDDLRHTLSIPDTATVFGRHGGPDTFDLKFVHKSIYKLCQTHEHLYFLFLGTPRFCKPHPRIIHLPSTIDMTFKTQFINTCDAMVHAQKHGETFGLSVGEFSTRNKPVITYANSHNHAHLDILSDKALTYTNKADFVSLITSFEPDTTKNWDAYSKQYGPEPVMERFKTVFLS